MLVVSHYITFMTFLAKNYNYIFAFVKFMPKVLSVPLFQTRCTRWLQTCIRVQLPARLPLHKNFMEVSCTRLCYALSTLVVQANNNDHDDDDDVVVASTIQQHMWYWHKLGCKQACNAMAVSLVLQFQQMSDWRLRNHRLAPTDRPSWLPESWPSVKVSLGGGPWVPTPQSRRCKGVRGSRPPSQGVTRRGSMSPNPQSRRCKGVHGSWSPVKVSPGGGSQVPNPQSKQCKGVSGSWPAVKGSSIHNNDANPRLFSG